MKPVPLRIDDRFLLDAFKPADARSLHSALNDKAIADNTLTIPCPYTLRDAERWLANYGIAMNGQPQRSWAVRDTDGNVCGCIGFHFKYGPGSHKDEFGYWLKRSLWGQGIMTKVVHTFCSLAFEQRELVRLEAPVFAFNTSSAAVLKKNHFVLEGRIRKAYYKNNRYIDALLYAKLRDTVE